MRLILVKRNVGKHPTALVLGIARVDFSGLNWSCKENFYLIYFCLFFSPLQLKEFVVTLVDT